MRKTILGLCVTLAFALSAAAQHNHGSKGPNGGAMEDVAGVHAELVARGNTVTVHITNEDGKPVSTKAYSASVLIAGGGGRETLTLAPSGENALKGDAKTPIAPGAQITLQLRTDKGKSGQARFRN